MHLGRTRLHDYALAQLVLRLLHGGRDAAAEAPLV